MFEKWVMELYPTHASAESPFSAIEYIHNSSLNISQKLLWVPLKYPIWCEIHTISVQCALSLHTFILQYKKQLNTYLVSFIIDVIMAAGS